MISAPQEQSPSQKFYVSPPTPSPPRRRSQSLPRPGTVPFALSSPLPDKSEKFVLTDYRQDEPKPKLSLQTMHTIPAMSVTPATPVNRPSAPSTPENLHKGGSSQLRSWSRMSSSSATQREDKPIPTSASAGGGVWGSLVNAANKVTDTLSSLTAPSNSSVLPVNRTMGGASLEEGVANSVTRPRSQTMPSSSASPERDQEKRPRQMAIDTLGEGDLSLKELGFESDTPSLLPPSGELSVRSASVQDEIRDGGQETEFSVAAARSENFGGSRAADDRRTESIRKGRRSLTVPTRGEEVSSENERRAKVDGFKKARRLSSLSKASGVYRNESITSRASAELPATDEIARRPGKRSSLVTSDAGIESPKFKGGGTPDTSDDRENEDGLYIHGKDGKKRKVPITGFAVQSGKRNRDFHALFKSVEESDYLIEGELWKEVY